MATIKMQRNLVVTLKKETLLNVKSLSRFHPLETRLSRDLFKENALDKLTQKLFTHLSYYLVCIIDNQLSSKLPWPLYDAESQRAYRNGLAVLIKAYNGKGLSPVLSSYLINPNSYKVTLLIYQMSQLGIEKTLKANMKKESQKKIYNDITECYKSQNMEEFKKVIAKETGNLLQKFSSYMCKRKNMEKIAEIISNRTTEMETKISTMDPQKYINSLVDGFIAKYKVDDNLYKELLAIKNVHKPAKIFETWLLEVDEQVSNLESEWDQKMVPFLRLCTNTQNSSQMLIDRISGKADKNSYLLEYDPKTHNICTENLESQVNSEQKYILKNIVKKNQLNFPNLIRGYLVAISFILKNTQDNDDIYRINTYLEEATGKYSKIVMSMTELMEKVTVISSKLKRLKDVEDKTLPDLSYLKMGKDFYPYIVYDWFTSLNISKLQFGSNIIPISQGPSDDFLRSSISDRSNTTQHLNLTSISQSNFRNNETIARSTGFTKDQVMRLLSTKKSSSSKKFRYKSERPDNIKIKRGGLFNESQNTNDNALYRSYSSPNLSEHKENRFKRVQKMPTVQENSPFNIKIKRGGLFNESQNTNDNALYRSYSSPNLSEHKENRFKRVQKMPTVQENSPLLEVSEISILKDNNYVANENCTAISRKLLDPNLRISLTDENTTKDIVKSPQTVNFHTLNLPKLNNIVLDKSKPETTGISSDTNKNSLESIINRYKKVRASVLLSKTEKIDGKENFNMDLGKNVLLPDLLSPNCSEQLSISTENLNDVCFDCDDARRPLRESLGTLLGVDHTFLDQFELID